jgi:hypothetical protein
MLPNYGIKPLYRLKKSSRHLHHRLVLSPPAGLTGIRRAGEPNLCVEVLIKIVFFSILS